jgi:hypothetical protein
MLNARRLFIWPSAIMLALAALFAALPAAAQDSAVLRAETPELTVGAGQLEVLNLMIDGAAGAYGIDIRASFDPALVEVYDADAERDGVQMVPGPLLKPDFLVRNEVDNTAGTLRYVITQVNPTPPATGSGVVLSIILRGKAEGATGKLTIDAVEIADRTGTLLSVTGEAAALAVVAPRPGAEMSPAVAALLAAPAAPAAISSTQPQPAASTALAQAAPAPAGAAVVRLDPPVLTLGPGEEASATVVFDSAEEIYGAELSLRFDPAVVEVVDADAAREGVQAQAGPWLRDGFVAVNRADNAAGALDFAGTLMRPAPAVSGSQVIATFTVRARGSGSATLDLTRAILATRDGVPLNSSVEPGRVAVGGAEQAGQDAAPITAAVPAERTVAPTAQINPVALVALGAVAAVGVMLLGAYVVTGRRR